MEKSREEIERLKKDWSFDPCWDIETTDGFEDHHDELLIFRLKKEAEWNKEANERENELASKYQCSVNLIKHIQFLENKIELLERRIGNLES